MKKTLKIKFIGFGNGFDPQKFYIYQILEERYNIEICDNPDYIICTLFGEKYEYCKYNQVRIMWSGENYIPDFNLIDYAISPYPIDFLDRHFYCPMAYDSLGHCCRLKDKNRNYNKDILGKKIFFANFICSHESENGIRGDFFKKLSEYKRVESPGTYLNNMDNEFTVTRQKDIKIDFQKLCKFTLCFESTKHEGFVTEKITDAFYSDTIPIYYGSSTVKQIFNPKAFINVSDYESFEDAINYIIKLDQNDELYINMLRQPIFNNTKFITEIEKERAEFLYHIFDQSLEDCYRRSRVYIPKEFEDSIKDNFFPKKTTFMKRVKRYFTNIIIQSKQKGERR